MSRYIDADCLKKRLHPFVYWDVTAMAMAVDEDDIDAESTVVLPPVAPTMKWIKVEEKLPKQDMLILLWDGEHIRTGWHTNNGWETECWHFRDGQITHWLPLPEAPKEEAQ